MNKISKIVSVVVGLITSVSVVVGVFSSGNNDAGDASSVIAQNESSVVENNGIPYIGANGNWWICGIDTGESAQQISSESSENQNTNTNSNNNPNANSGNNIVLNNQTEVNIELQSPQYYIGANGNWWINGKDSGIKAVITENKTDTSNKTNNSSKNDNSDKTDSSSSEKNNSSSTTVYEIGANGNWWINGKDTGIKAPVNSNGNNQNTETSSKKSDPVSTSSMVSSQKPESVTTSSQGTSSTEILTDPADIVDAAYKLEAGEKMGYDVTLTGKVTEIITPYNADFNCISVIIEVEGKEILCYRMTGTAKDIRAIIYGDTITVTGLIKNYNGTVEFDIGCVMRKRVAGGVTVETNPKKIVDAAFALEKGKSLPYAVTLTGKITKINTLYDAAYKNITVTIEVEGTKETEELKCYRMKGEGAENLKVGDTIAVTGIIKKYLHSSGKCEVEFDAGCTFVKK